MKINKYNFQKQFNIFKRLRFYVANNTSPKHSYLQIILDLSKRSGHDYNLYALAFTLKFGSGKFPLSVTSHHTTNR